MSHQTKIAVGIEETPTSSVEINNMIKINFYNKYMAVVPTMDLGGDPIAIEKGIENRSTDPVSYNKNRLEGKSWNKMECRI